MQTTFGFSERRACGLVGVDLELAHTLIISDDGPVLQTSFYSRNQIWTEQSSSRARRQRTASCRSSDGLLHSADAVPRGRLAGRPLWPFAHL